MLKDLARLFVDNSCYSCEKELVEGEEAVCLACLGQIEQSNFHLDPEKNELYYRLAGRVPLAGATALFFFDKKGRLQKLMQAMKYDNAPKLGVFLGKCLGDVLKGSEFIKEVKVIMPVPLHKSKLISRGYNQAEAIANGLGEVLELPVDTHSLKRTRKTISQTRKSGSARWENVKGAFEVKGSLPSDILLVDDVITTGSTLEACLQALHAAEQAPQSVRLAAIGMARMHG